MPHASSTFTLLKYSNFQQTASASSTYTTTEIFCNLILYMPKDPKDHLIQTFFQDHVSCFTPFTNFNFHITGGSFDHLNPMYLHAITIHTIKAESTSPASKIFSFKINATANSTVPALLNAFEISFLLPFETKMTNRNDSKK